MPKSKGSTIPLNAFLSDGGTGTSMILEHEHYIMDIIDDEGSGVMGVMAERSRQLRETVPVPPPNDSVIEVAQDWQQGDEEVVGGVCSTSRECLVERLRLLIAAMVRKRKRVRRIYMGVTIDPNRRLGHYIQHDMRYTCTCMSIHSQRVCGTGSGTQCRHTGGGDDGVRRW